MPNSNEIYEREKKLKERLQKIESLEKEAELREKKLRQKESARKQVILRISPSLWNDISEWAEQDFRSINSQIEFILTEAVKKRKNKD